MHEQQLSGLEALEMTTRLLQRQRNAHATKGLYEAAELQFWWSKPRPSDQLDQLFWLDDAGAPVAAAILVDFTDGPSLLYHEITFCPLVMPNASPDDLAHIIDRGLAHAAELGFTSVELEVDQADSSTRRLLNVRGFTVQEEGMLVECWLTVTDEREISPLSDGYTLVSRAETDHLPHHMNHRRANGLNIDDRLTQLSLYRPDLDLVVLDADDEPAGWGIFWYDPVTGTGVVEPMRTMDDHQKRGLARHILTAGVDRLAKAGAKRISIGYEPDNPASGHLYRSVGFEPCTTNDLLSGPTSI